MENFSSIIVLIVLIIIAILINKSIKNSRNKQPQNDYNNETNTIKYCPTCGVEVHTNAVICVKCGCALPSRYIEADVPSMGLNIFSIFFPIIGLILFLAYNNKFPLKAKGLLRATIIGFIINIILTIILLTT